MNIFYLDRNKKTCAQYHCDSHVVKMCVEYAQLLSTAVRILEPNLHRPDWPYKSTHVLHPCAIWTRKSPQNFKFLQELAIELGDEFTQRYGKEHKSIREVVKRIVVPPESLFADNKFTEPPQCMPDEFKCTDTVEAYKNYYRGAKKSFAKWKNKTPEWWT